MSLANVSKLGNNSEPCIIYPSADKVPSHALVRFALIFNLACLWFNTSSNIVSPKIVLFEINKLCSISFVYNNEPYNSFPSGGLIVISCPSLIISHSIGLIFLPSESNKLNCPWSISFISLTFPIGAMNFILDAIGLKFNVLPELHLPKLQNRNCLPEYIQSFTSAISLL